MLNKIKDAGFPESFKVIHLFEGGSALHGAYLALLCRKNLIAGRYPES